MAYVALSNFDFEIKHSDKPSNFGVSNKPPKYHWHCYVKERGYMFFGESEIALYCNIIKRIVGNRAIIPFN